MIIRTLAAVALLVSWVSPLAAELLTIETVAGTGAMDIDREGVLRRTLPFGVAPI